MGDRVGVLEVLAKKQAQFFCHFQCGCCLKVGETAKSNCGGEQGFGDRKLGDLGVVLSLDIMNVDIVLDVE
eukprot:12771542-Ditylum_brightwellii.AAC.1